MVFNDPYKVGGSLQTVLEGSLQTKDVIDGAGCTYLSISKSQILSAKISIWITNLQTDLIIDKRRLHLFEGKQSWVFTFYQIIWQITLQIISNFH